MESRIMAGHSGIKLNGEKDLLFAMDSKSTKSSAADDNILSDWVEQWTVGTTQASTGFGANGDGNSRILDVNPYGAFTAIWDVSDQDAASDADGGWNSSTFDIDNTKMYRFSTWVKRKTIGNGSFYLGTYGRNAASTNVGILTRSNGTSTTNPYFVARNWWGNANQWYFVVGHVWPAGSGTGVVHPDSGIFDLNGNKILNTVDFVWQTDNEKSTHRSYLYYSTDTSTNQQWWNPRVEIVPVPDVVAIRARKFAPPVQRLIASGIGGRWNLRNRIGEAAGVVGLRKVRKTTDGFSFAANDEDQSIQVPLAGNFNKLEGTISAWVYPTAYNGSNGIFVNRDSSTVNSTDWLWIGMWNNGSTFYFRIGQASGCCSNDLTFGSASSSIPLNTWTNIDCTWKSAGQSIIYINGELKVSRTISTIPATNPSATGRIGLGHGNGSARSWDGKIDQFKIYGRQLDAIEILKNYNALKKRFGL